MIDAAIAILTGLIFGASGALVIGLGAAGWSYTQGFRIGRRVGVSEERGRWDWIFPADERFTDVSDEEIEDFLGSES
jgi:hypothetical protein